MRRVRAVRFPAFVHSLWTMARSVADSSGTGWTWVWSNQRGSSQGGRSREVDRREVGDVAWGVCMLWVGL
ncbi:hypothetical protein F511_41128 [Dorcoceras hygrometricum]|uniref:Secreted protein n=1 Tax=Dorcoceras hygrometricum TaxID=472368 RepID=A0A2Z7B9S3_9LAMI|nr:hypothetical protein F511_41128 [Dorcoceras hygrometricum]